MLDDEDSDLEILDDNDNNRNQSLSSSTFRGRIRNRRKSGGRRKSSGRRRTRPKSLINPRTIDDDSDDEFNSKNCRMFPKKAEISIGTRKTRKSTRGFTLGVDDETEADDEAEKDYTISNKTIKNKKRKLR